MPSRRTEPSVPAKEMTPPQPSAMEDVHTMEDVRPDPQDTFEYSEPLPDESTYDNGYDEGK